MDGYEIPPEITRTMTGIGVIRNVTWRGPKNLDPLWLRLWRGAGIGAGTLFVGSKNW